MFVVSTGAVRSADSGRADRALAPTGAIDRAATIDLAANAVSSDSNAGFNADAPRAHANTAIDADTGRAHANTGSDTEAGCAGANAWNDAHTARAPALGRLPNTALRRAICVTVNSGLSRRCNQN